MKATIYLITAGFVTPAIISAHSGPWCILDSLVAHAGRLGSLPLSCLDGVVVLTKGQQIRRMVKIDAARNSWIYHMDVMMSEFCNICTERNYVDKMIELPCDSDEEKHLHKSLFDCAREMPMESCGSLLVCLLSSGKYSTIPIS